MEILLESQVFADFFLGRRLSVFVCCASLLLVQKNEVPKSIYSSQNENGSEATYPFYGELYVCLYKQLEESECIVANTEHITTSSTLSSISDKFPMPPEFR